MEARPQSAQGLDAVFAPRSVAVVGASPDPASVGHRLLASILRNGFTGQAWPIHPRAAEVLGRPAHRSVLDVPGPVDLAVVAVPARHVLGVAEECGRKGVRALVVVTAGFREAGPAGLELEELLRGAVLRHGMRLVGPNCLGVANADPAVRLHALFADVPVPGGPCALMTQSGALGVALLQRGSEIGLGVGRFASMGNKLDVSGNDLLLLWEGDPGVRTILMHLESVGNPRNFVRIARRVGRRAPILMVKGGRSAAGAKAAGSHTGAMMEADALVDAMVEQAGVLRCGTVQEMFEAALAASLQPLPAGGRVAVATNSGGPAILLADALPSLGLRLADFCAPTRARLASLLPPEATLGNPLDLLAGAGPAGLAAALEAALEDPGVDAAVALFTPLAPDDRPWAEAVLAAAARHPGKPLLAVPFGRDESSPGFRALVAGGIPAYTYPENAARALGALHRLAGFRARPEPEEAPPWTLPPTQGPPGWMPVDQAMAAAARLGLPVPASRLVARPEQAAQAAAGVGLPAAVKVVAPGLVHKTDVGAVAVGLATPEEAARRAAQAWRRAEEAGHAPSGVYVQAMAPDGVEAIVGAVRDPRFGPAVSFGLGGIHAEALRDVVVRLAPVDLAEARRMAGSIRGAALLSGARGRPPGDAEALARAIVAVSRFAAADPRVEEFEVNPLRVLPSGVVAVDARLRLGPA